MCKHNPKVNPFDIAVVKKSHVKLGDAGTIEPFDLAFQYQIKQKQKFKKKKGNGQKYLSFEN